MAMPLCWQDRCKRFAGNAHATPYRGLTMGNADPQTRLCLSSVAIQPQGTSSTWNAVLKSPNENLPPYLVPLVHS